MFGQKKVKTFTLHRFLLINITGPPNQWISLPTILLGFTLENTDVSTNTDAELRPISTGAFFSRVRVMMGDVIVCDLNSTSRADAMKDLLKTSEAKRADEVLGLEIHLIITMLDF